MKHIYRSREIIRYFPLLTAFLVTFLFFSRPAGALSLCPGEVLVDRGLYILEIQCWKQITSGSIEPTAQLRARANAKLLYLFRAPPEYKTAVVFKQKDYVPAEVIDANGNKRKLKPPTQTVIIERPAIYNNRCGNRRALNAHLPTSFGWGTESLNKYNRYHAQTGNYVQGTLQLRQFHFSYPIANLGCRATNDLVTGNRGQYVLNGFEVEPSNPFSAWFAHSFGSPQYHNDYYSYLRVRHVYSSAKLRLPTGITPEGFRAVFFNTPGLADTRLELTISDLENRNLGRFFPNIWTIDWTR